MSTATCPACGKRVTPLGENGRSLWLGATWHSTCIPRLDTGYADLSRGYALLHAAAFEDKQLHEEDDRV